MICLSQKNMVIFQCYRIHFRECDLPNYTFQRVCTDINNRTGYPSRAVEITPSFLWGKGCSVLVFMLSFVYYSRLLCLNISLVTCVSLFHFKHSRCLNIVLEFEVLMLLILELHIILFRTRLIRVPQISLMWTKCL